MGAHEYHGTASSRAGRRQNKLGPGIIDARRLDELLHPDAAPEKPGADQGTFPSTVPEWDEGGEA